MGSNKTDTYLLQKWDNGDFFVYRWTPMLAGKGYKVMTAEDAKPYLDLQLVGKSNVSFLEDTKHFDGVKPSNQATEFQAVDAEGRAVDVNVADIEDLDDSETQSIISDMYDDAEEIDDYEIDGTLDEVKLLEVSQESILEKELSFVKSCTHPKTLEKHFLEKYQIELPQEKFLTVKAMADSMLRDLAGSNRLYLIDNQIKVK